jgi:hypothetical protein
LFCEKQNEKRLHIFVRSAYNKGNKINAEDTLTDLRERLIFWLEEEKAKCAKIRDDAQEALLRAEQDLYSIEERLKLETENTGKSNTESNSAKQNDETINVKKSPSDMLKSEFHGISLTKVAQKILSTRAPATLNNDQLTEIAYNTTSHEEFLQARGSFAALLRTGAGKYGWRKVGRGQYQWTGFSEKQNGEP